MIRRYLLYLSSFSHQKPHICIDERYLIKDLSFSLYTIKYVHRLIDKDYVVASPDDKSCYDHILVNSNSIQYFEILFAVWCMVFNTHPFGFKASTLIYHTTCLVPISYCCFLGTFFLIVYR